MNIDALPFVGAVHRRARSATPTLIVIHSGETNEGSTAAEGMASYFASGKTTGSAHICVDNDSAVRCAYDNERTNGAGGVNDIGLHLEQAGRAGQSAGEWADAYSQAVVAHAAEVCKGWIAKFPHIRPVFLDSAALRRGERNGITTHAQVSPVFAGNDGHWDPGPNYPIQRLLDLIGGSVPSPAPSVPQEDDTMLVHTIGAETHYSISESSWRQLHPLEVLVLAQGGAKFVDLTPEATQVLQRIADENYTKLHAGPLATLVAWIAKLFPKKAERAGTP